MVQNVIHYLWSYGSVRSSVFRTYGTTYGKDKYVNKVGGGEGRGSWQLNQHNACFLHYLHHRAARHDNPPMVPYVRLHLNKDLKTYHFTKVTRLRHIILNSIYHYSPTLLTPNFVPLLCPTFDPEPAPT